MGLNILHISADYPDAINPRKTKAISYLVEADKGDNTHVVYSLNRKSPPLGSFAKNVLKNPARPKIAIHLERQNDQVTAVVYSGAPGGLYMARAMECLADQIGEDLDKRGIKPDLVHGHKLTLEGLIAERLSKRYGCPYAVSIQVNTDEKILRYRPDLRARYRRIFHQASLVFPFSVMGLRVFECAFGHRANKTVILPCSSPQDRIIAPQLTDPVIASVFHLKDYKNKNLKALLTAAKILENKYPDFSFELYGGGTRAEEDRISELIAKSGTNTFRKMGAIGHDQVQEMLNGKAGFAMIPKRETFGMVFIEALLAGCPVVYPENWAIDGLFENASFAVSAPSNDQEAITTAIERLIKDQSAMKAELAQWQTDGRLNRFQRTAINACYLDTLAQLSHAKHQKPPESRPNYSKSGI